MNFFDDGSEPTAFRSGENGPMMAAGCRKEKLVLLWWAQPKMATAQIGVENYQANPPVVFYTPHHDSVCNKWSKKHWNAHAKKTSKLLHHASFPESSCRKGNGNVSTIFSNINFSLLLSLYFTAAAVTGECGIGILGARQCPTFSFSALDICTVYTIC